MAQPQLYNNQVIVRLEDVICPELEVVVAHLTGEAEVVGAIKFLSEGPGGREEFAIVEERFPTVSIIRILPDTEVLRKKDETIRSISFELENDPNKGFEGIAFNPMEKTLYVVTERSPWHIGFRLWVWFWVVRRWVRVIRWFIRWRFRWGCRWRLLRGICYFSSRRYIICVVNSRS